MAKLEYNTRWEDERVVSSVEFPHKEILLALMTDILGYLKSEADIDPEIFLGDRFSNDYAAVRHIIIYICFKKFIEHQDKTGLFYPKISCRSFTAMFNRDHTLLYHSCNMVDKIRSLKGSSNRGGYRVHEDFLQAHAQKIVSIIEAWFYTKVVSAQQVAC